MGYSLSSLEQDTHMHGGGVQTGDGADLRGGHAGGFGLENEIFHRTRIRSQPSGGTTGNAANGARKVPVSVLRMLSGRESNLSKRGRFSSADCCHVLNNYLPVNGPCQVDQMRSRTYVSQFSADGSLLVAGYQESGIRIYNVEKDWKLQKAIIPRNFRWTITDTNLSADRKYLVYASMTPIAHIVNVRTSTTESHANVNEIHDGLDFSLHGDVKYPFAIFSVKFSSDSRELVAGSNDESIYVYDLEANKVKTRFQAHSLDVNTVTFGDETGNLIFSGSDDHLCKVWDRRCFRTQGQAAGVLMGHLEGITHIDSRGDGRYFISNSKDQTIKLWDIRKMSSNINGSSVENYDWDYRFSQNPPQNSRRAHPSDRSLATYRGHSVLRTLIRCYFSPSYSTAQRYIYTGSHDGSVYIYDVVSGEQVAKLQYHKQPVRDCSWHPCFPMLVSSSWDGMVTSWEFPGGKKKSLPPARDCIESQMYRVLLLR